jgi:hypothetical protein
MAAFLGMHPKISSDAAALINYAEEHAMPEPLIL